MSLQLVHEIKQGSEIAFTHGLVRAFASAINPDQKLDIKYDDVSRLAQSLQSVKVSGRKFVPAVEMRDGSVGSRLAHVMDQDSLGLTDEIVKIFAPVVCPARTNFGTADLQKIDAVFRKTEFMAGNGIHRFVPAIA